MREQHLRPKNNPVKLHNYLPEPFTFYWDKEPYTIPAGESVTMFEWLATHGAIKMAERWFHLNPTNVKAKDPKQQGFYSRHDDAFKAKVNEAIIRPSVAPASGLSETAAAVAMMNEEETIEVPAPKKGKREIELKTADDADEIVVGCRECRATGPRHKPTCSQFKPHTKDASQAAKLAEAAS